MKVSHDIHRRTGGKPSASLRFSRGLAAALMATCSVLAIAEGAPQTTAVRIDTQRPEELTRVRVGDVVLRLPRAIVGNLPPPPPLLKVFGREFTLPESLRFMSSNKSPDQLIPELDHLSFAFWYPDMAITCFGPGCPIVETKTGERFRVVVGWMYYSPWEPSNPLAPRPSDKLMNLANGATPQLKPSPYQGLDSVSFGDWFTKRYPNSRFHPAGGLYVQARDRPYELFVACGSRCASDLFSKRHRFQLMFFTNRTDDVVLTHMEDLAKLLNDITEKWEFSSQTTNKGTNQ